MPGSDMPYLPRSLGKGSQPTQPNLRVLSPDKLKPGSCVSWAPSGSPCPYLPERDGPPSLQLSILGLNVAPSPRLPSPVHSRGDLGGQRRSPGWQLIEPRQCPIRSLSRRMFEALGDPEGSGFGRSPAERRWDRGREEEPGLTDGPPHPKPSALSLADDDDANSYENVLICRQQQPESGEAASPELGRGGW